jgi:hypothetical protein
MMKTVSMKKLLFFLLIVLSWNMNAQQTVVTSKVTIELYDSAAIKLMDTVEAKLNRELIISHQGNGTLWQYWVNGYNTALWDNPMTISAAKAFEYKGEKIGTNKYEIAINWNKSLDTAYILGFSKEYYYAINEQYYNVYRKQVYCRPLYLVPLIEYKKFLTKEEFTAVLDLIKAYFVGSLCDMYSYEDNYSKDRDISLTTMEFKKSDSLTQLPWPYWTETLYRGIKSGELGVYADYKCLKPETRGKADTDLLYFQKIEDTLGNSTYMAQPASFWGIKVCNRWVFDTNGLKKSEYVMKVSWKNETIGLIKENAEKYEPYKSPVWLKTKAIDTMYTREEQANNINLYHVLINSMLYRKLDLWFR